MATASKPVQAPRNTDHSKQRIVGKRFSLYATNQRRIFQAKINVFYNYHIVSILMLENLNALLL